MHLTPLTAMTYDIEALAMERVKGVSDTNLLGQITKNIRSLECVAGTGADPQTRPCGSHQETAQFIKKA
jgi:hypothetical protein